MSTVLVASTLTNLAGDFNTRPNFLRSTILSNAMNLGSSRKKDGLSPHLNKSYLSGPSMTWRSFFRWGLRDDLGGGTNYDTVGYPTAKLQSAVNVTEAIMEEQVLTALAVLDPTVDPANDDAVFTPPPPGPLEGIKLDKANPGWWAGAWLIQEAGSAPTPYNSVWSADYIISTGLIEVYYVDIGSGTPAVASFDPADVVGAPDYDTTGEDSYVYSVFQLERATTPGVLEGPYIDIYLVGSGNDDIDDNIEDATISEAEFYPFIPIRLDNQFLSDTHIADAYEQSKTAYKKAVGGNLDEIIQQLEEHPDKDDIDYAYVVFGVPLNALEQSSRKYIFRFFKFLQDRTEALLGGTTAAEKIVEIRTAQAVGLAAETSPSNFWMQVSWLDITETEGTGVLTNADTGNPAKADAIWLVQAGDVTTVYWQQTNTSWRAVAVTGLVHRNYIYRDKNVETKAVDALLDADESGFLLPLHFPIFRDMPLVDSTQLTTQCCFIVINTYEVKKQSFLGKFLKVLAVLVVIAVVLFAPQLAPGLVKLAATTGALLGLTGVAALIIGTLVVTFGSMLVASLITKGAVAIFGEKLGTIIGFLATIAVTQGLSNLATTGTFSVGFEAFFKADNLLRLTEATGQLATRMIAAEVHDTVLETQRAAEEYGRKMQELQKAYAALGGFGDTLLNPMSITGNIFGDLFGIVDSLGSFVGSIGELPGEFLERTLMVGSDIIDLSMDSLYEFPQYTVSNTLPGTDLN